MIYLKAGAFADTTYGISNKSTLEGTSYVFNDIQLPENIFDVGDQHGLSDLSGPSRYSLYDKVEFDGASYYYLSHAESSRTYRDFADVKSEVLRGAFKLELPGKAELEDLFASTILSGTNSVRNISNDDVWSQDYWFSESESVDLTHRCGWLIALTRYFQVVG